MILRVHLTQDLLWERGGIRFGWLFLSLALLAGAGYFLYPSFESFTKRKAEAEIEPATPQAPPAPVSFYADARSWPPFLSGRPRAGPAT